MNREGVHVTFMLPDLRTTLPLKLTFRSGPRGKIVEMIERWGRIKANLTERTLQREMTMGRLGGTWLIVSEEQYQILLKKKLAAQKLKTIR